MARPEPSSSPAMVRSFEPRDATAVEQLVKKCPEAAAWSTESYQKLIQRGHSAWIVVEGNHHVCGFLVVRAVAGQGEILNLAVDPAHRRAGHASALLQRAVAEFQGHNITNIFLEVRASNSAAISFYQRHGFVRTGERPAYYHNPSE